MFLWWSWSPDLQQWFGPNGLISQDLLQQWRGGWAFSIFDRTTTESSLWAAYGAGFVAFFMLTAGVATTGAAVAAIFFWISLLHRGPMLAGSADDVMTIVLFCLVIGPSGAQISVDRMIGWNRQELVSWRAGWPCPSQAPRGSNHGILIACTAQGRCMVGRNRGMVDGFQNRIEPY